MLFDISQVFWAILLCEPELLLPDAILTLFSKTIQQKK